jgi:hypothetical protein
MRINVRSSLVRPLVARRRKEAKEMRDRRYAPMGGKEALE